MKRHDRDSFVDARSIPAFKPILQKWIAVQLAYSKAMGNADQTWWYRERTCVGFLSAAVWQSGGVTLEEWQTKKGPKEQSRHGRCDLYACRGKQEFFIEAKHMYSNALENRDRELRNIQRTLDKARKDASLLQCEECLKLGVLFLAPVYPTGHDSIHRHISEWLKEIEEKIHHSAMAWLYQPRRTIKSGGGEKIAPGIVLLAAQPD